MGILQTYARRVAQHEAGHLVVANALGFKTGAIEVEILAYGNYRGGSVIFLAQGHADLLHLESYLFNRVQVLFAGALSEALSDDQPSKIDSAAATDILESESCKDDYAKAKELLNILRGIRFPYTDNTETDIATTQLNAVCDEAWLAASQIVELHAPTIIGLARNLARKVTAAKSPVIITAAEIETYPDILALRPK